VIGRFLVQWDQWRFNCRARDEAVASYAPSSVAAEMFPKPRFRDAKPMQVGPAIQGRPGMRRLR